MKTKLSLSILLIISICSFSQSFEKITVGTYVTDSSNCVDAAWGDYDKDGDLDLFITTSFASGANLQSKDFLFQNNCNGELTKVQAIPGGLTEAGQWSNNAVWIDYDNDDDLDLYVSTGAIDNLLYQNQGNGTFVKITGVNIIDFSEAGDARGISWADYDNDGYLDLFVTEQGWLENKLFHNNGDGSFTKITDGDIVNTLTRFSGCAWSDYDNDGDADLFVTTRWITPQENYVNYFYENNGDGTFTRILDNGISNDPRMSWWKLGVNYSCYWIDYNNDRHMDLYITSVYGADYLYKNNGDKTFTSITNQPIVTTDSRSNGGAAWGDYDNDGDLDVVVSTFGQNLFFENDGAGSFTQNTQEIISNDIAVESYGMAWADYDNDGDLDLYIPNAFGSPNNFFYVNVYQNNGVTNNWFKISCKGIQSNTQAVGAKVYIKANINGNDVWQMREISAGSSLWGGGNSGVSGLVCHFGLGDATIIDTLKVVWPASGITQIFTDVEVNRFVQIVEDENNIYASKDCKADLPIKNPGIVKGVVYNDVDNDCEFNSSIDYYLPNRIIKASVGDYYVITNDNGEYELRLPSGNYDINQIQLANETLQVSDCPTSDPLYNINVIENQTLQGYDFVSVLEKLECGVSFWAIPPDTNPCPGSSTQLCFVVYNNGPSISNFQTSITDNLGLITSESPCNLNPLPATQPCMHCVTVTVPNDPLTYFGLNIIINFTFSGVCQGDSISGSYTDSIPINCASDPNDKTLNPEGCGEENIVDINSDLVYRLRFQNIGNAPAKDILVSDKLDKNLDISSFKILDLSHSLTRFEIIPDNNLIFKFDNIMLPDSASNPEGSNGYIVFSVKPKTDVAEGTIIKNQAGIYFDYNAVVLTNTTSNLLMSDPKPVADFNVKHSCTEEGLLFDFYYTGNYTGFETFYWNFGNEATPQYSTEINPSNIAFLTSGYKNITLTVDRGGCSSTITKEVDIFDTSCGKDKVLICHNGNTICISKNALPAHLAHGDCIGKCENENKNARIINEQVVNDYSLYFDIESRNVVLSSNEVINDVVFQIYDYSGKLILSNSLNQVQEGNTYINVNNLAPGFYLGLAKTSHSKKVVKIICY